MRQVIVFQRREGDWLAECPSLPGCRARGESKAHALDAIKEAIDQYVAELKTYHAPIPEDNAQAAVVLV
jgi:predicted RNase H-like HicB family nuclease